MTARFKDAPGPVGLACAEVADYLRRQPMPPEGPDPSRRAVLLAVVVCGPEATFPRLCEVSGRSRLEVAEALSYWSVRRVVEPRHGVPDTVWAPTTALLENRLIPDSPPAAVE